MKKLIFLVLFILIFTSCEKKYDFTGTWRSDDEKLTIIMRDNPVDFIYVGYDSIDCTPTNIAIDDNIYYFDILIQIDDDEEYTLINRRFNITKWENQLSVIIFITTQTHPPDSVKTKVVSYILSSNWRDE